MRKLTLCLAAGTVAFLAGTTGVEPALAQGDSLPRCVEGCSPEARDAAFADAGVKVGECHAQARLTIAPDGGVTAVHLVTSDDDEGCARAMVRWAGSTRWNAVAGDRERTVYVGSPGPGTIQFRTSYAPKDLDPGRHVLLAHPDPAVRLEDLLRRYPALGPVEELDEVRADGPTLCAIGKAADGVALRSASLTDRAVPAGFDEIMNVAEAAFPDLVLYGADVLPDGGTCLLLGPAPQ